MWRVVPLLLVLAAPAWAAERVGAPEVVAFDQVDVRVDGAALHRVVLRPGAVAPGRQDPWELLAVEGRHGGGRLPLRWLSTTERGGGGSPLFGGAVDMARCRHPRVSADGFAALAVCRGTSPTAPSREHLVVRRGARVERLQVSVAPIEGGARPALSADGTVAAIISLDGSDRVLRVMDLVGERVWTLQGPWEEPRGPELADDGVAVGLSATLGGDRVALLLSLVGGEGVVLGRGKTRAAALAVGQGGEPTLFSVDVAQQRAAAVAWPQTGRLQWLSDDNWDVEAGALGGGTVAFAARVGGLRAVYTVDLSRGLMRNPLGAAGQTYHDLSLSPGGRLVYEERSDAALVRLFDLRAGEVTARLPAGCDQPDLSADGALLVTRCETSSVPAGVYLFDTPKESP